MGYISDMKLHTTKHWLLILILSLFALLGFIACGVNNEDPAEEKNIQFIADRVWEFSQSHPQGFTLEIHSMTEPTEGVCASYAATQNCHSRENLDRVVAHALDHDGYVGGWYNSTDSLYYFDSSKLFPLDELEDAFLFGKENGQYAVYNLSTQTEIPVGATIASILERDTIFIGTTGDYRPLTYMEPETGEHWGFGIEVAQEIAERLGVEVIFVGTSWPTLTADVMNESKLFDFAIGGITITDTRLKTMLMSNGYLANGKTILCRITDTCKYKSLNDIDKPEVQVMVNPGGLNEKFANDNLKQASIIVHPKNEEIPTMVAEGKADIMITEITEAPYYVKVDNRLAAPLLDNPFTRGEIGVLMRKGQDDLLQLVNNVIYQMKADGSMLALHNKYGLVYAYSNNTDN